MADVLIIATAGCSPNQKNDIEHKYYPRTDYIELQKFIDSNLLDYNVYNQTPFGKIFRKIETQVRSDLYLTYLGLLEQRHHQLVFNMSERVGIPFSALNRGIPWKRQTVSMFTCWSSRQEFAMTRLHLYSSINKIAVHSQSMQQHFISLGIPREKVHIIPYSVDQNFFLPQADIEPIPNFLFSVGETRSRDYPTLLRAVEGLPLNLLIAASGQWYAREKDSAIHNRVPPNVTFGGHYSLVEIRKIYSQCQFVVLPIMNVVYSAGATAVLEAMCMGKAVVATCSQGIKDYIKNGETGILVESGDECGLKNAIQYLLAHPEESRRMGQNGRQWVEDYLNLDRYVQQMADLLVRELP